MTPDSHIKQHINMFRAAEGGLDDFRLVMNGYYHKVSLTPIENFHLYLLCVLCNACSLIKNYCFADHRWEEIYITGNIYILINESIKKIIGYPPKDGSQKSFRCGSKKGYFCDIIYNELNDIQKTEFEEIRESLINYANNKDIQRMKNSERNVSIHFDDNLNAFNLFSSQIHRNAQLAFNNLIVLFSLIHKLHSFICKTLVTYTEKHE